MQYVAPQADCTQVRSVKDDAWFLVFIAVLLALGATIVLGAAVWCIYNGNGRFTGGVKWANGLQVWIECRP
ncbi:hypothetical protein [Desmospora profundinema]|uniref:Uncharacterized protein n=1 Tax=Desmospora profundinema TaxID=1571184 RepID=A0ABU1INN6_9BACL|nr:hypothetical protein [Desmospora profundinema]MDR6226132.1 hypothetical protein [Desmospora profundinema]